MAETKTKLKQINLKQFGVAIITSMDFVSAVSTTFKPNSISFAMLKPSITILI